MDRINVDHAQLRRDIVRVTEWANQLARSEAGQGEQLDYQRFKVDVLDRIAAANPDDGEAATIALRARQVLGAMERGATDAG